MITQKEMEHYIGLCVDSYYEKDGRQLADTTYKKEKETDTELFTGVKDDCLYIVFQGTKTKKDWMYDFMFGKKVIPYDNFNSKIKVHKGLITKYRAVREWIHQQVKWNFLPRVIIIGHSLGGGLATLCSVDLQYNFPHLDIRIVTFGSLRVGNKAFVESYSRRLRDVTRVVNDNDWIAWLPFALLGYRHVCKKTKIGPISLIPSLKHHDYKDYLYEISREGLK